MEPIVFRGHGQEYDWYVCVCVVHRAHSDPVHAGEAPARLHLPAPRQGGARPRIHHHPARLLHLHVDHQEHQDDVHRLPTHGGHATGFRDSALTCGDWNLMGI